MAIRTLKPFAPSSHSHPQAIRTIKPFAPSSYSHHQAIAPRLFAHPKGDII